MQKIPTLFKRVFDDKGHVASITSEVTKGLENVLSECTMTLKVDGACCAVIDGVFYKRYDAKRGKKPPEGAIECSAPDPITGHHPHWVRVTEDPSDRWFVAALNTYVMSNLIEMENLTDEECRMRVVPDGTYEAIGKHFQSNPYGLDYDILVPHGNVVLTDIPATFEGIKNALAEKRIEGIVFWSEDGAPVCKIKRRDFGYEWPCKDPDKSFLE